jgi:Tfp pilus assembly protein PilX
VELVNHVSVGRQRGLSLIYAMLALAVLALATVALIRSVSTGAVVAGNLGFQQEATAAADQAVRQAVASLGARLAAASTGLDADGVITGYYASSDDLVDVTGSQSSLNTRKLVRWDANYCAAQASGTYASCAFVPAAVSAINKNAASYIVFRLCDRTGDPVADTTINCARPLAASATSGTNEGRDYTGGSGTSTSVVTPYYRIVVRVTGARNTTSYTETIVHF